MVPLPPLNLNQSSSATSGVGGGSAIGSSGGDWIVNIGGSGTATQAAGMPSWALLAAGLAVAWLVFRRR